MNHVDQLVQLITDRLLEKLTAVTFSVCVIGDDDLKTRFVKHGYHLVDDIKQADQVVIDEVRLTSWLHLANLNPSEGIEADILERLLSGRPVWMKDTAMHLEAYKPTAKSQLYRDVTERKEKLIKYGVQFYEEGTIFSLLQHTKSQVEAPQVENRPLAVGQKKILITESKLREMDLRDQETFVLEKGMIITALARDYLKRHHIQILS